MKKLLSLLLIVCLAVSFSIGLVGCGSQAPPPDGGSVEPVEETGEEYEAGEAGIGEDEGGAGAPEETTGEAP